MSRPKHVIEMEQRAKERADKRAKLNEVYEQKRQVVEQEKLDKLRQVQEHEMQLIQ